MNKLAFLNRPGMPTRQRFNDHSTLLASYMYTNGKAENYSYDTYGADQQVTTNLGLLATYTYLEDLW